MGPEEGDASYYYLKFKNTLTDFDDSHHLALI